MIWSWRQFFNRAVAKRGSCVSHATVAQARGSVLHFAQPLPNEVCSPLT